MTNAIKTTLDNGQVVPFQVCPDGFVWNDKEEIVADINWMMQGVTMRGTGAALTWVDFDEALAWVDTQIKNEI